jgi:hypothetical protein
VKGKGSSDRAQHQPVIKALKSGTISKLSLQARVANHAAGKTKS